MIMWEKERPSASLIRALLPFKRAPSSRPHHLPEAPPPHPITAEVRALTYEFGVGVGAGVWGARGHKHSLEGKGLKPGFESVLVVTGSRVV